MIKLKLVSSKLSPFGHRVEMTLIKKNITFEKVEIDLTNKPDWFLKDSPLGKVPILYCDDKVLFESNAICEYIDEISLKNTLHPQDKFLKALNRGWIEFCNNLITSIFGIASAENEQSFSEKIDDFHQKIKIFETHINPDPYFNGESFCLIDICFASLFIPLNYIQSKYGLKLLDKNSKIHRYSEKLSELELAKKIITNDYGRTLEYFLHRKHSYLLKLPKNSTKNLI